MDQSHLAFLQQLFGGNAYDKELNRMDAGVDAAQQRLAATEDSRVAHERSVEQQAMTAEQNLAAEVYRNWTGDRDAELKRLREQENLLREAQVTLNPNDPEDAEFLSMIPGLLAENTASIEAVSNLRPSASDVLSGDLPSVPVGAPIGGTDFISGVAQRGRSSETALKQNEVARSEAVSENEELSLLARSGSLSEEQLSAVQERMSLNDAFIARVDNAARSGVGLGESFAGWERLPELRDRSGVVDITSQQANTYLDNTLKQIENWAGAAEQDLDGARRILDNTVAAWEGNPHGDVIISQVESALVATGSPAAKGALVEWYLDLLGEYRGDSGNPAVQELLNKAADRLGVDSDEYARLSEFAGSALDSPVSEMASIELKDARNASRILGFDVDLAELEVDLERHRADREVALDYVDDVDGILNKIMLSVASGDVENVKVWRARAQNPEFYSVPSSVVGVLHSYSDEQWDELEALALEARNHLRDSMQWQREEWERGRQQFEIDLRNASLNASMVRESYAADLVASFASEDDLETYIALSQRDEGFVEAAGEGFFDLLRLRWRVSEAVGERNSDMELLKAMEAAPENTPEFMDGYVSQLLKVYGDMPGGVSMDRATAERLARRLLSEDEMMLTDWEMNNWRTLAEINEIIAGMQGEGRPDFSMLKDLANLSKLPLDNAVNYLRTKFPNCYGGIPGDPTSPFHLMDGTACPPEAQDEINRYMAIAGAQSDDAYETALTALAVFFPELMNPLGLSPSSGGLSVMTDNAIDYVTGLSGVDLELLSESGGNGEYYRGVIATASRDLELAASVGMDWVFTDPVSGIVHELSADEVQAWAGELGVAGHAGSALLPEGAGRSLNEVAVSAFNRATPEGGRSVVTTGFLEDYDGERVGGHGAAIDVVFFDADGGDMGVPFGSPFNFPVELVHAGAVPGGRGAGNFAVYRPAGSRIEDKNGREVFLQMGHLQDWSDYGVGDMERFRSEAPNMILRVARELASEDGHVLTSSGVEFDFGRLTQGMANAAEQLGEGKRGWAAELNQSFRSAAAQWAADLGVPREDLEYYKRAVDAVADREFGYPLMMSPGRVFNPGEVLALQGNTGDVYSNSGGSGAHVDMRLVVRDGDGFVSIDRSPMGVGENEMSMLMAAFLGGGR